MRKLAEKIIGVMFLLGVFIFCCATSLQYIQDMILYSFIDKPFPEGLLAQFFTRSAVVIGLAIVINYYATKYPMPFKIALAFSVSLIFVVSIATLGYLFGELSSVLSNKWVLVPVLVFAAGGAIIMLKIGVKLLRLEVFVQKNPESLDP